MTIYDGSWWRSLPQVLSGQDTIFDLCGDCGISRDQHPREVRAGSSGVQIICGGTDWRKIGYVGDYGDPRPPSFNGAEPYRDPNEPAEKGHLCYPWALPDNLPPSMIG